MIGISIYDQEILFFYLSTMKTREEIEELLGQLRALKEKSENAFNPDVLKIGLLTMRIEALEWVLGEDDDWG